MGTTTISKKVREWYHLGGPELVLKGAFTKFESSFLPLDDGEALTTISLNGVEYRVREGEPAYRWRRFERGIIMPEVKRPMDEILGPSDTFIDVGAAPGDTPLYGHSLVGDSGRVYAFDPDPFRFEDLQRNVDRNDLENVDPLQTAVGAEEGKLDPMDIVGRGGTDQLRENADDIDPIEVVDLDGFITSHGVEPDLVKIDVDGVEDLVLRGSTDQILGECPIILELHNTDILENRSETIDWLFDRVDELEFLGVQGNAVSEYNYGETLTGPEDLENDVVTNLLIR